MGRYCGCDSTLDRQNDIAVTKGRMRETTRTGKMPRKDPGGVA